MRIEPTLPQLLRLTFRLSEGIEIIRVDGDNLLREPNEERIFRISDASARLLGRIGQSPVTGDALVDFLSTSYTTERIKIESMVAGFLKQMLSTQVVRADGGGEPEVVVKERRPRQAILKLGITRSLDSLLSPRLLPLPIMSRRRWAATVTVVSATALFWVVLTLHSYGKSGLGLHTGRWMYAGIVMWIMAHIAVHEFAHSATCKRVGGHIKEFGVGLLYYLIPVAYVEFSDSYRLSKNRRAAIALAGPVTDLLLASVTSVVVWLGPQGLRTVAIHVLFYEMSIFFFNCNPLMPSDLYKVMENLMGVVGMRKRSFEYLRTLIFRRTLPAYLTGVSGFTKATYVLYASVSAAYLGIILALLFVYYVSLIPHLF